MSYTREHINDLIYLIKKYDLEVDKHFYNYSCEQLAEIYNGAGSDGMPEILRGLLTKLLDDYEPAFLIHDFDFFRYILLAQLNISNLRLLKNCRKIVAQKYTWWRPLQKFAKYRECRLIFYACQHYINSR